jgi:hypothetical protein
MIRLYRRYVDKVVDAGTAADLFEPLQNAIELEHSTIPPYLTAALSMKPGCNQDIAGLIRTVTGQEMLHMCIVCNILLAIGGQPSINHMGFAPSYPGPLPMHIGGDGFEVGIEAFSIRLLKETFMRIEEPENPLPIRVALDMPDYTTIGAFYAALQKKILELGDAIFQPASVPKQVLEGRWFPSDQLFAIRSAQDAVRAIDLIVRQGEGTSTEPFEVKGTPAHYYQFGEIVAGRRLVVEPAGFAYAGEAIPFDPDGVYPLKPNCRIADFEPGSQAHVRITRFNYDYNCLLNALHHCFNGEPDKLDVAIGIMYSLRTDAVALMQTPVAAGSGLCVGPSFEYVRV